MRGGLTQRGGSMIVRRLATLLVAIVTAGCHPAPLRARSDPAPARAVHAIVLPGAPPGGVAMDYLAYDRVHHRVWVPAGNTGSVDVVDAVDGRVSRIEGFATMEVERRGTKRTVGPSAATVGDGVVYVGNRGDSSVCAVDAESLRIGPCVKLDSMPDGLAWVAATREVWATAPRDRSITVIDAAAAGRLTVTARIGLPGAPEGFAVDDARGVFFTNLEDRDRTLVIDLRSRRVTQTWLAGCGGDGPRGLALDRGRDVLFVACTNRVMVLDAGRDGRRLSTIDVGDGLDNIDYVEPRRELYAAAARAAKLTVARLDSGGQLTPLATVATAPGARNAVATDDGTAYLADSPEGRLLVVAPVAP
jgi:DNA-binding beta-propeller fold protein YncE